MRSALRPSHHRLRLTGVAGLGTLITAVLLVTSQFPAVARVFGVAGLVLALGVLLVLGTKRSRTSIAIGDCHNAAALLLQKPDPSASHRAPEDLPTQLLDGGHGSAK